MRIICTLAVVCLLSGTAAAQSVLNFTPRSIDAGIAITNPGSATADVQFSLYNSDGTLAGGNNPIRYRIAGRGQLQSMASGIFGLDRILSTQWIQVTSATNGLQGNSFSGDFQKTLDGTDALTGMDLQVIPYIRSSQTEVVLTNPGMQQADLSVAFFDTNGGPVGAVQQVRLGAHEQTVLAGVGVSAKISSNQKVLAVARIGTAESLTLVKGQAVEPAPAQTRVVPHFELSSGATLAVMNPTGSPVKVTARFVAPGTPPNPDTQDVTLQPNASHTFSWGVGNPFQLSPLEGWVEVSSAPVNFVTILESGNTAAAFPMQTAPVNRMMFYWPKSEDFNSQIAAVQTSEQPTDLTYTLVRADGSTVAKQTLSLFPRQKQTANLGELFPNSEGAYLVVESPARFFAVEMAESADQGRLTTAIAAQPLPGTVSTAPTTRPRFLNPTLLETTPGVFEITVNSENAGSAPLLIIGNQSIALKETIPGGTTFTATINTNNPPFEVGFVLAKLRVGGVDSEPVMLQLVPQALAYATLSGRALYQKILVTDNGLETNNAVMVPIRGMRVEVVERNTDNVISVSETNDQGGFKVAVPIRPDLTVRVISRLGFPAVRVADNTASNRLYSIAKDVDMRFPPAGLIELIDRTRDSGAFNILDVVQRGNELITSVDSRTVPPAVTIYWSEKNTRTFGSIKDGFVGTTFFKLSDNTAYVLGDRLTDSDEFDDSVIAHEYAHMLAAKFSRDDSPGGAHFLGDLLDPRVSWSEGLANFFSAAVLGSPIYRDSKVTGLGLRYDLEENIPAGDNPGYRSEASVQSLLWDLIDENADADDVAQFPFASVWPAITDLQNNRFVYLPFFFERFGDRNPGFVDSLQAMVRSRNIDFLPTERPSVTNPFPTVIVPNTGRTEQGQVDSLTTRRTNLAQSSHFFAFTTPRGGSARITLRIDGAGPGNNLNANDLDLFLFDANGTEVRRSDSGLNGDTELINGVTIPAGFYVIEVRSFYKRLETNSFVFNSGSYKLTLDIQ